MSRVYTSQLQNQIIRLYGEGLSFSVIAKRLGVNRHRIPHILIEKGVTLRLPWQGTPGEWSKMYEKTPRGFLMRTYRNMQSRVAGIQKRSAHLYKGLPILAKNDFYAWAWDNTNFWRLYKQWAASEYDRRLTPSINRIDTREGYILSNMEWLTMSVNASLGASSPRRHNKNYLVEVYEYAKA